MESGVAQNLSCKGYEAFLPTFKVQRRWSDRLKTIDLPLFPSYVFCRFDATRRLPVLMIPGVHNVVAVAGTPQAIDAAEIDAIRTAVHSGMNCEPHAYVNIGQMVRITDGVLSGLAGFVVYIKNERRLILSVQLLMRSVSVELDSIAVEPIIDRKGHQRFLPANAVTTLTRSR
jgi:transcription antitermination factor NusG